MKIKRIFLICFMFLLVIPFIYSTECIKQEWYEGTGSANYGWMNPTGRNYVAQVFQVVNGTFQLDQIEVRVKGGNNNGGTVELYLFDYFAGGGYPLNKLATLKDDMTGLWVNSSVYVQINLTLTTPFNLTNGTKYSLVWNGTAVTGGNTPYYFEGSTAYPFGEAMYAHPSATTWSSQSLDQWFRLYTCNFSDTPSNKLNISNNPNPPNSSQFNTDSIFFNITVNSSYDFSCSFYLNNTLLSLNNYTNGVNVFVANNINLSDGYYNYFYSCENNETEENSTLRTFLIDTVNPLISSSFSDNLTFAVDFLTGSINVSDDHLYSFNISIDGDLIYNVSNLAGTIIQYNLSFNVSNLTAGYHNITSCASDGHTGDDIKDYPNEKDMNDKSITYRFGMDYIKIYPLDKNLFIGLDTYKSKDRYIFKFVRALSSKSDLTFVIESTQPITEPKKKDYLGWFIIPGLNKWVDFETSEKYKVTTERVNDYKYLVHVDGVTKDEIIFKSIGELNSVCKSYSWDKVSYSVEGISSAIEKTTHLFNLTFDYGGTYNINSSLTYNGNVYIPSKSGDRFYYSLLLDWNENLTQEYNYYWNFSINNSKYSQNNKTGDYLFNSEMMALGLCIINDSLNTTAINFSFYDEVNPLISSQAEISGFAYIWFNPLYKRNYTFNDSTLRKSHTICIYPPYINLSIDGYIHYLNTTSPIKSYNLPGILNNITKYVSLYLLDNSSSAPVLLNVVDNNGYPFGGVLVKIQRWNPITSNYNEINQLITDFQGDIRFYVTLYTIEYRFVFEYPVGTLRDITPKNYITDLTLQYQLIIPDILLEDLFDQMETVGNVTFSNITNKFIFNWYDYLDEVDNACLYVYESMGSLDPRLINSSCTASSSGSINIVIAGVDGRTYTGKGFVFRDGDSQFLDSASYKFRGVIPDFGGILTFFSCILCFVVAFGIGKSLPIAVAITPLPIILLSAINLINLNVGIALGIEILALIVAGLIGRGYN